MIIGNWITQESMGSFVLYKSSHPPLASWRDTEAREFHCGEFWTGKEIERVKEQESEGFREKCVGSLYNVQTCRFFIVKNYFWRILYLKLGRFFNFC
ncbi:unnamed protein product [Moneuplotes crassus]|uniref:Uncharacterized protein n=1 Tax=Euplotes crassus TaxID=5936 RepID=A0AAD1XZC1_EUPCR|nr:unnamed protein product [Moneuplotes crassus]